MIDLINSIYRQLNLIGSSPQFIQLLNVGSKSTDCYLNNIQKIIDYEFLQSYWEFLSLYNTDLEIFEITLSDKELIYETLMRREKDAAFWLSLEDDEATDEEKYEMIPFFDKRIKKDNISKYFYPHRLTIALDEVSALYIDFEPSEFGKKGQIIFTEIGDSTEIVVADSFEELLNRYLIDLKAGDYICEAGNMLFSPNTLEKSLLINKLKELAPPIFIIDNENY